jgi:hypothetical protein
MHRTLATIAIAVLCVASAAPARAQTIVALQDYDTARAGLRVGYGGHGMDLQASIDSRRYVSLARLRADVGHGHWLGINAEEFAPRVTRVGVSALFYFAPRHQPELPAYVGVGIAAFVPHADGFAARVGGRLILGMELSVERWTAGPEIEFDLTPGKLDRFQRKELVPTFRVGIAIRRHF